MLDICDVSLTDPDEPMADFIDEAIALASAEVYKHPQPDSELALALTYNDLVGCKVLVGIHGEMLGGMLAYRENGMDGSARIEAVVTSPKLQRVAGIGSALVEHLVNRLTVGQIGHITLSAADGSEGFYDRIGFSPTGNGREREMWL